VRASGVVGSGRGDMKDLGNGRIEGRVLKGLVRGGEFYRGDRRRGAPKDGQLDLAREDAVEEGMWVYITTALYWI